MTNAPKRRLIAPLTSSVDTTGLTTEDIAQVHAAKLPLRALVAYALRLAHQDGYTLQTYACARCEERCVPCVTRKGVDDCVLCTKTRMGCEWEDDDAMDIDVW